MTPPKVECKDQSKIRPKEFLEYFDNVDAFILISWENQPRNLKKKLKFEDAEKFAPRNLLVPQQKQLLKLIQTIYDISELTFVAPENRGSVIFWQSVTTAMAKAKLCAKLSTESSLQNCSRELMRIKFVSPFGLTDPLRRADAAQVCSNVGFVADGGPCEYSVAKAARQIVSERW